ncbi:hypothetical protein SKAU_G00413850 [Synaphobranchus kaupii]|uniref:Uncharacterized protein n=1 Tax=Synaphobranchus kaupii TaxID=118154 RepID=A0A9Q1IBA1_SYNKA|nr:hypothetical protein SKAU_G00413850 [Synaphobranchus kaupii]
MAKDFRKGSEANTLKDCDIGNAEDIVQLMTPIKIATIVMCEEEQPTVSVIAPLKAKLLKHLEPYEDDSAVVKEMKRVMVDDLSDRYSDVQDTLHRGCAGPQDGGPQEHEALAFDRMVCPQESGLAAPGSQRMAGPQEHEALASDR